MSASGPSGPLVLSFFIIYKSVIDMEAPTVSCNFDASKNNKSFAGLLLILKKFSESALKVGHLSGNH